MSKRLIPCLSVLIVVLAGLAWSATPSLAESKSAPLQARASADDGYEVVAKDAAQPKGAPQTFEADNPANNLRLTFTGDGVVAVPREGEAAPWSLDLRVSSVGFLGQKTPLRPAAMTASGTGVAYDFGTAAVRYVNSAGGLEQVFTVPVPAGLGGRTGDVTLAIDLAIGNALKPQLSPYFVDLVTAGGERVLRYGAIQATDAKGNKLEGDIQVVPESEGSPASVRIVVALKDAASPVEVRAALRPPTGLSVAPSAALGVTQTAASRVVPSAMPRVAQSVAGSEGIAAIATPLSAPITETVDQIMARDSLMPLTSGAPRETHPEFELELKKQDNPLAPATSSWPLVDQLQSLSTGGGPLAPQALGTSFKGVGISESGYIPPDSMGDVGPTQVLMHENGRIKVFDKAGNLGALNATDLAFWTSVDAGSQPSDPEVRYDRLSGRWILLAMNSVNPNNLVMVAYTAPNATINGSTVWTFTSFQGPNAADGAFADCLMDYPSLGIDNNALYIGCNMFCGASTTTESYVHSNLFVLPKVGGAPGGGGTVFRFPNVNNGGAGPGPYAPMGVDNDDAQATEGYFIGVDVALFSQLDIIKISNPGSTPTIAGTFTLTVPKTVNPILQPALGSTTSLDVGDDRLIKAAIHKNKITGADTLWTAHHSEVNTSCVAASGGGRNGARWYEIAGTAPTAAQPLAGSIMLKQAGTLCDPAASAPRGYIYPSVVETGQGHMALGATFGSTADRAGVAVAGRLRTDTPGATQAATVAVTGAAAYQVVSNSRNRWGDYSFSDVDPLDDQTVWTFQEYADTPANNWSVRAIQLKAPLPATPSSASNSVCQGRSSTKVVITGTSSSGTEFFDPGPDPGGPGYTNHISASLAGGTAPTVNSITFTDPTHVTLDLNTTAATTGAKNVTITNPDGQVATGTGVVNVVATCSASISGTVTDSGSGLGINGATVTAQNLSTTTSSTGAYSFSNLPAGTYAVAVTAPGYSSGSANVTIVDGQNAIQNFSLTLGVSDTAACKTDTSEVDFEAGTVSGLDTYSSPGNVVLPLTTPSLDQVNTTLALIANTVTTTAWYAQSFVPAVSGNLSAVTIYAGTTSLTGSPQVSVSVYNDNGSGSPGTAVAGATANSGTFPAANTIYTITLNLGTPAAITAGTKYHLVFKGTITNARGFVSPSCSGTCNPYTNGNGTSTTTSGGTWTTQAYDFPFATYVIPTTATGTLVSSLKNANPPTGNTARWSLSWTGSTVANTTMQFQAAASNSPTGPFTFVGPGGSTSAFWTTSPVSAADMAQFNGFQYFQYKVTMSRTALVTPTLNDVTVCFTDGCQGAADGSACNDGNPCTTSDTCQNNVCVGASPVSCTAGDQCNLPATCNVGTGTCSSVAPKPDGTACNDSSACTTGDVCTGGACAGTAITCNDNNVCTDDTCDPATGCVFTNNTSACDDGSACTTGDVCTGGTCAGTAITCNDNNVCTDDTCDPATGCVYTNNTNPCNDGNPCTQTDTCSGGACVGSNPVTCNDNNPCTDDACNPSNGTCQYVANDSNPCTDGNACTNDACVGGTCVGTANGACGATGSVFYYRSNVSPGTEPTTKPVPSVGIDSNADAVAEATTDNSGAYSIGNLAGHVTLAPLAKFGAPRISDHNGAITSLDASLIARTAVGAATMSPNQRLAGDVTGNGTLTGLDAAQVARFAAELVDHFDVGVSTGSDWKFLRCDAYAYPGNPGCGAPIYEYNPIAGPATNQNFYAILYGEVTGNWQPAPAFAASSLTRETSLEEQAAFKADQLAAARIREANARQVVRAPGSGPVNLTLTGWTVLQAGQRRQLTIDLRNADGILAVDLALKYDPSRIAIVDVVSAGIGSGLNVAHGDQKGTHRISAYGVLPLSGSGSVLTVTVEALKNTGRQVPLTVTGSANEGQIPLQIGLQRDIAPALSK